MKKYRNFFILYIYNYFKKVISYKCIFHDDTKEKIVDKIFLQIFHFF